MFDSLARLNFKEKEGKPVTALGMYAKDGEYVEFNEECDCTGAVNIYTFILFLNITL